MTAMIIDGRRRFGCSLPAFYARHDIVQAAALRGIIVPPVGPPDQEATPALAFINPLAPLEPVARWLARCPDCPGGTAYVWLDMPIMFCLFCGNADIGGAWRLVTLPRDPQAIEALLILRPDPSQWAWEPGESLARLRADNALIGVA